MNDAAAFALVAVLCFLAFYCWMAFEAVKGAC
jgi:hypothetical protein